MFDISVIIVNYNTGKILIDCIDSLLRQKNVNLQIIVVDNNSQDESLALLSSYSSKIKLIANDENIGFGRANNLALRDCRFSIVLMINPDAAFTQDDQLLKMSQYLLSRPKLGLIGAPLRDDDLYITGPFHHYYKQDLMHHDRQHLPGDIAWVLGACMLARKKALQQVNGFDEDYFLYGEETDLCLRLRLAQWHIGFCSSVMIYHIGGASEAQNSSYHRSMKKQKALQLFLDKHYPQSAAKQLLKKICLRAKMRYQLYRMKAWFLSNAKDHCRLQHYQAVAQVSKEALKDYGRSST